MRGDWQYHAKAWLVAIMMALAAATHAETVVGGMTARQAFPEDHLARLVAAVDRGDYSEADRQRLAGANVNAVGTAAISPLLWVTIASLDAKKLDYLLSIGADPNYRTDDGMSAMYLAAAWKRSDLLEALLAHGGDVNLMGMKNEPLLFAAVRGRSDENLRMLVQHGADVNKTDSVGDTAGDMATALGRFDYVVFLLEHGLTHNLQDLAKGVEIRKVPADSDAQRQKDKVIEMLKERGVTFPAFVSKSQIH